MSFLLYKNNVSLPIIDEAACPLCCGCCRVAFSGCWQLLPVVVELI